MEIEQGSDKWTIGQTIDEVLIVNIEFIRTHRQWSLATTGRR